MDTFARFASPEGAPIFDLTDFAETHPAPFEWDAKRRSASFAVGAPTRYAGGTDRRADGSDGLSRSCPDIEAANPTFATEPRFQKFRTRAAPARPGCSGVPASGTR
jgi:hypothetical protein